MGITQWWIIGGGCIVAVAIVSVTFWAALVMAGRQEDLADRNRK